MFEIEEITVDALQEQTLILFDGSALVLTLHYIEMQRGWFIRRLVHNDDFTVTNIRIGKNFNIVNQFKNLIPFGLACLSDEDRDPTQQEDFSSKSFNLFILTSEELDAFGAALANAEI